MPRTCGESSRSTALPIPRRPSERSVSRWRELVPLADLTWVMTSVMPAPPPPARTRRPRRRSPRRCRARGRPTGRAAPRSPPAAGANAGTGRGGLEEHAPRAVHAGRLMRDRRPVAGHAEEVLLRALDALLDRQRHLVRLAVADADDAVLVTDHNKRGEREAPAALDHLGDAVDLHHALLEVEACAGYGSVGSCHAFLRV